MSVLALRVTKKLSIDEIAERLALPKTTVYYWVKDLPLGRARRGPRGSPMRPRRCSGETLGIEPSAIRLQRKSNGERLRSRVWRCVHGVAAIELNDTYLRDRIQAWIDRISQEWALHSATPLGA